MGGGNGCALLTDGELHCWGTNDGAQLIGTEKLAEPHGIWTIASNNDWVSIIVAGSTFCALDKSGQAVCWGNNLGGSLGRGIANHELSYSGEPAPVTSAQRFVHLFGGTFAFFARTSDGGLYGWGRGSDGRMGQGVAERENPSPIEMRID